ncbi:hypothetical protein U9M48_031118 [Paspalum notatum var. saurae]|uniref:Uncharacterized protein n=1 Tax=Paspalum notatum var. saurae TaxID=547442 RepID=A0AAQ3X4E4_PASNO
MDLHAPEAVADEAETQLGKQVSFEAQILQHGAPGEDEVQVASFDGHAAEAELAEAGEGSAAREAIRVGKPPEGEVEAGERGHAEERGGEVLVEVQGPRAVDEEELRDALDGEVLEPARYPGSVPVHVGAGEEGAAERAMVRGEDAGDGCGDGVRVGAVDVARDLVLAGPEEVGVAEDERGGAPDGSPAAGEHGGARRVFDWEARDDVYEERSGEAAESVDAAAVGVGEEAEAAGDGDGRTGKGAVDVGERVAHVRPEFLPFPAIEAIKHVHLAGHGLVRRRRPPVLEGEEARRLRVLVWVSKTRKFLIWAFESREFGGSPTFNILDLQLHMGEDDVLESRTTQMQEGKDNEDITVNDTIKHEYHE